MATDKLKDVYGVHSSSQVKMFYWHLVAGLKRRLKKGLTLPAEFIFKKAEKSLIREDIADIKYAPIFIICPPRAGSTLLYQLITTHFTVCYFSNFMMLFRSTPVVMAKILSRVNGCNPSESFSSTYGETMGWRSPNQGREIWYRWFPSDNSYVGSGIISKYALGEIRNTIALIQSAFDAPFVNKWPVNSGRLLPIAEAFPEALFIRVKRDPVFVAQSILRAKRTLLKNDKEWVSAKPRNHNIIKHKEPLEQACEQVFYIEKDIDRDSKFIGEEKFMSVHYEEICKSPHRVMGEIANFYKRRWKNIILGARHKVPSSFQSSDSVKVTLDEFKFIKTILRSSTNNCRRSSEDLLVMMKQIFIWD